MTFIHRLAVLTVAAITLVAAPANAEGDYAKAKRAYDAGAIDLAMRYLPSLARRSDRRAQFLLGYIYEHGKFEEKSLVKARLWYEKSAAQDYTQAMGHLGSLIIRKRDKPNDRSRGLNLLEAAATRGHVFSQRELGIALYDSDKARAKYWLTRAVDKLDREAALVLAVWYFDLKSRQGHHQAYYWMLIHRQLTNLDGYDFDRSKMIGPMMTYREAAEVERRAAAWLSARGVEP